MILIHFRFIRTILSGIVFNSLFELQIDVNHFYILYFFN